MNYGELQTALTSRLNRRDATAAQIAQFLQESMKRIQRELRVPAMEKSIEATVGNIFTDGLVVPGDLLQFIALTDVLNGTELTRTTLPTCLHLQLHDLSGCARHFARRGSKFLIAPLPAQGSILRMDYYATFQPLVNSTDTNVLTDIADDLILQGALVYGCTQFNDKRKSGFEADYQQTLGTLNDQANRDELTANSQVSPAYRFDED